MKHDLNVPYKISNPSTQKGKSSAAKNSVAEVIFAVIPWKKTIQFLLTLREFFFIKSSSTCTMTYSHHRWVG